MNPFGGKKSASKVFRDVVKPLLEDADVQITVQGLDFILYCAYWIFDAYVYDDCWSCSYAY